MPKLSEVQHVAVQMYLFVKFKRANGILLDYFNRCVIITKYYDV